MSSAANYNHPATWFWKNKLLKQKTHCTKLSFTRIHYMYFISIDVCAKISSHSNSSERKNENKIRCDFRLKLFKCNNKTLLLPLIRKLPECYFYPCMLRLLPALVVNIVNWLIDLLWLKHVRWQTNCLKQYNTQSGNLDLLWWKVRPLLSCFDLFPIWLAYQSPRTENEMHYMVKSTN